MKDILINYPIKILQQELINIRTSYRLEKKRIIEILKDMKSIKKLTKEELIDLLIKYNYDISKLPKLEDLIKPKKEPKVKKEELKPKKEEEPKKNEELKKEEELKKSTYIPSDYLFNKEYYFDDKIWEKNYTIKDLIENWDTDIIPIIFEKIEPKKYDIFEEMVKKVNGIISKKGLKKNTSILIPELLVFTKDINNKILEYYIKEAGTKKYKYKYAIDKLYRGFFRIIERIYIENRIPRNNITNVFGDDQETLYLRGVKQGLPILTLQAASKELLLWDDKIGTFIRNPETLL